MAKPLPALSIVQLTLVRIKEFVREPEAMFWSFVFPLLLAAGLGIAFRSRPPEQLRVALVRDAASDSLEQVLERGGGLVIDILDDTTALKRLRTGQVALVAARDADGSIRYEFDPERPDGRAARFLVNDALQRAAGRPDPVKVVERTVQERGSRYIDFFIPGLLGMNLMSSGIWGIAFSVVTARNRKLLKRLAATPMSRAEYLASYLLSRLGFLAAEVIVIVGFGAVVFNVPVRGSIGVFALVSLLGALAFSGLGLLVSSRATTVEGASGLANLVMLPQWIFSGVFFSSKNFPDALQPFISLLPLTATVDALRGNLLQGSGLVELAPHLAIIAGWLVVTFAVALRMFRWR